MDLYKLWESLSSTLIKIIDNYTFLLIVFLASLILLFLKKYSVELAMQFIYINYTGIIIILLVVSLAGILAKLIISLIIFCNKKAEIRVKKKEKLQYEASVITKLEFINHWEKDLLVWAVSNNTNTIPYHPNTYQYLNSLVTKGILENANGTELVSSYVIEDFVWEVIRKDLRFKKTQQIDYPGTD